MFQKFEFILILFFLIVQNISGQKNIRVFIFGHSLINHEFQLNPTPSQETSVPHWMHFISEEAGHTIEVSGQYGFLPQHANLPPIAQWGFDFVTGAWDSDFESFSDADFNSILITPGNFIQWQGPTENYPMETISPISATSQIFNWCNGQEDSLKFYIYENWPDMGPYLFNGFPPNSSEWNDYNTYLNGDFHEWFLAYQDILAEEIPNSCIKMIPVGPIISNLLLQAPYDEIPIEELYEDDAPHGRPNIYFLASLITYMAMFEEKAPINYKVNDFIHPIISEHFEITINLIWDLLMEFKNEHGNSRVFCTEPLHSKTSHQNSNTQIELFPNPVSEFLQIRNTLDTHWITIYGLDGLRHSPAIKIHKYETRIDLGHLPQGIYTIFGWNKDQRSLYQKKIVKL